MADAFTEFVEDLDANDADAKTSIINVQENKIFGFAVIPLSGSHSNHTIQVQCSFNILDFFDVEDRNTSPADVVHVDGIGITDMHFTVAKFLRFVVSTPEGSPSMVKVFLNAK